MCNIRNDLFVIISLIVFDILALPAIALDQDFDINSDLEMDRRFNWTIDVQVEDTKFLNYPGSTLKPLTKLLISYRLSPQLNAMGGKPIQYEELWYQVDHAIGCRRFHDLNIPETNQGAIRIVPSSSASKNSDAISGAIIRLLLDIRLKQCLLSTVFVPFDNFEDVENNLSRYNFYSYKTGRIPASSPIALHMCSNPLYKNPANIIDVLYYCQ